MADISFIRQIPHGWFTLDFWLCTCLMFLVEFGCAVLGAPSPRLLEIVVCREYYQQIGGSLTQQDCKIQEVQERLGFVLTFMSTCSILAGQSSATPGE